MGSREVTKVIQYRSAHEAARATRSFFIVAPAALFMVIVGEAASASHCRTA